MMMRAINYLMSTEPVIVCVHARPKMPAVGGCRLCMGGVCNQCVKVFADVLLLRPCLAPVGGAPGYTVPLGIPGVIVGEREAAV